MGQINYDSIGERMAHFGGGKPQLEFFRPQGARNRIAALLVIFPPHEQERDGRTTNELSGGDAELSPWQKPNRLLGFGFARDCETAADQALDAAERGDVEQMAIQVWWDREARRFRFYVGGRRRPPDYRPRGRELTADVVKTLLKPV